ncbi:unnamed protein product [Clavelina lepadiformis]|uniref:Uncharacterized protein n=1 Tax=Clavelina lepadiformis TaxID=159417 RepID=A0ABP0GQ08_CLALP
MGRPEECRPVLLAGCLVELVSLGVLRRAIEESLEVDVDFEKNKESREDLEALAPARLRVVQLLQLPAASAHLPTLVGYSCLPLKKSRGKEKKKRRRKKKKKNKKKKEREKRKRRWMDGSIDRCRWDKCCTPASLLKEEIDSWPM